MAPLNSLLCLVSPCRWAGSWFCTQLWTNFSPLSGQKSGRCCKRLRHQCVPEEEIQVCAVETAQNSLLSCNKTTLLGTEGISEETECPGCCLWAQRGADLFLFLSPQTVHEQKRRIQQTVGFHCLMLQRVESVAAFLMCCWLRDGRELHP